MAIIENKIKIGEQRPARAERKVKSVCGRYLAIFHGYKYSQSVVKDFQTGILYNEEPVEREGHYYAAKHGMTGFSARAVGMTPQRNYFTLTFADFVEGKKIKPYTGNTIIKEYTAIFKCPR